MAPTRAQSSLALYQDLAALALELPSRREHDLTAQRLTAAGPGRGAEVGDVRSEVLAYLPQGLETVAVPLHEHDLQP